LVLVETGFLASTAVLIWLFGYTPLSPIMRLLYPIPVAIAVMRWNPRTGMMALLVSGVLLSVLTGPTRAIPYVIPYALIGYWCARFWKQGSSWYHSMVWGTVISACGLMFQFALSSLLLGENLWTYLTIQMTTFTNWLIDGILGRFGVYPVATVEMIQITVVGLILVNSVIYVFTIHLVAALVMEKLRCPLPPPPRWVQFLLE
jgi:uncharacterized protein YybS (DUF2232 family)